MFAFFGFSLAHPLKIYKNTKCHGPTFTDAGFTSTSEARTPAILEWLQLRNYKLWRPGHLEWHDLRTEFRTKPTNC
jgi:hypothetical protein